MLLQNECQIWQFCITTKNSNNVICKKVIVCHGENYSVTHVCKILCWVKHNMTNIGGGGYMQLLW